MITLTLNDRDIHAYNKIKKEYLSAFDGESVEIPSAVAVRFARPGETAIVVTYKHLGNGVIGVHYEVEGYAILNTVTAAGVKYTKGGAKPYFDMKAKVRRENHQSKVSILEMPDDAFYAVWVNAGKTDKPQMTNFQFIMLLHHCATRILGYIPYAVEYKPYPSGHIMASLPKNFYEVASKGIEEHVREKTEKHRFDGWDVVRITWAQYEKMSSLVEETGKISSLSTLPLSRFAVYLAPLGNNPGLIAKFDANERKNEVSCLVELTSRTENVLYYYDVIPVANPLTGEKSLKFTVRNEDSGEIRADSPLLASCGGKLNTVEVIFEMFVNVSSFLLNYKDETMDVEERVCEKQSEGNHSKKHNRRNSVRLFKSYTLKKGWKTKANRKKAEIHCLAWGVRGHYRHYKSGKTIFISAYVKGKERAKYAGKDYLLFPEAN